MTLAMPAAPVTLLFTDLVDSTALLQRVGDEQAQRVLHAHRQLLREAIASHGGREVKWLGDGLLTTFASVADGVRCAVTMAQRARRPVAGERLGLRLGLHVGEVLADEDDYVGTPVVLARRLCDRAAAGQILCSGVVVELLRGRAGFGFAAVGALDLKGFAEPVAGHEVRYQPAAGAALLRHTPFTGRMAELRRLTRRLGETRAGQGGVVLVAGEPGIGKTRLLAEVAETARAQGALVLGGRCYEGETARPFGPFAEGLGEYVRTAPPEGLRADLGLYAAPLTRLVPQLRDRLPDVLEPVTLEPYEERVRLLDAVAQSLLALAARVPTVLVLDDLHWADPGTVTLLRHVARFAPRARLLVLGAYRDVEVAAHHPLTEALGTLPRETSYEQLALGGLDQPAVKELVDAVAERAVPAAWVEALTRETSGNPFFLREVLLHLGEEGAWAREDGSAPPTLEALGLPDTVRQVIMRRLARLSDATGQLLRVAAAFTGGIDFEVARRVAGLEERDALNALDAALGAQLLAATGAGATAYDFTHALVRHTLYEGLSPARQARLHRAIAEMTEAVYGDRAGEHAAEIARHYHRSATVPGAERGVPHCMAAAEQAERSSAFADVVAHLSAALDLLPATAPGRTRLLARLGLALPFAGRFDETDEAVAREAAMQIAEAEGCGAAAEYLAGVLNARRDVGAPPQHGGRLARQGLDFVGERRDAIWAVLKAHEIRAMEMNDSTGLGIALDTPERRELAAALRDMSSTSALTTIDPAFFDWVSGADFSMNRRYMVRTAQDLPRMRERAEELEHQGKIGRAVSQWAILSSFHATLGEFVQAHEARRRGSALAERLPEGQVATVFLVGAEDEWRMAMDEGWDAPMENVGPGMGQGAVRGHYRASLDAAIARRHARMGRCEPAMRRLAAVLPAIERAPAWAENYVKIACDAAETLWLIQRTDHIEIIERNLRQKVIEPDYRFVMMDGRLALARLCALQGRYDEARAWFAKARAVLDEQGARPVRAIVDYDEALMYARRAAPGDRDRAAPLVDAALAQFRTLGMPGWIRRAEALEARCGVPGAAMATDELGDATAPALSEPGDAVFHRDGEYWTLAYAGRIVRLRDTKGLQYIAHLLASPGREVHVADLVALDADAHGDGGEIPPSLVEGNLGTVLVDGRARAEYKKRLDELRDDLEEATRGGDIGRAARARHEIEQITRELTAAYGLGGRPRTTGDPVERLRKAVTNQIRRTLDRIRAEHPALGLHLEKGLRTGVFCSYTPERPVSWRL
jgi:class 3 adenylate cyclase/tetratricopeptide (TPR) repeat protein